MGFSDQFRSSKIVIIFCVGEFAVGEFVWGPIHRNSFEISSVVFGVKDDIGLPTIPDDSPLEQVCDGKVERGATGLMAPTTDAAEFL